MALACGRADDDPPPRLGNDEPISRSLSKLERRVDIGIGPTLATLGVIGALVDPKLTIYSGQTKIAENDNWGTPIAVGANQAVATADDIAAAARATGAFGLANGTKDAAVVITLSPGAYTAQVSSTTGLSGTALVEIYEIPE